MRKDSRKGMIMHQAAMYFAEIGEIPSRFADLSNKYPKGKPGCVQKRIWSKYWRSWGHYIDQIKKHEPELCALALNPQPAPVIEEPVVETKDPLEALRASTTEK